MSDSITLRSQEFGQRSNLAYDQQRYDAMQGTGQAVQQAGAQVNQAIETDRALDQRDRGLDLQQQGQQHSMATVDRQMAMEEAESGLRMQALEVEKDFGYEKLLATKALNEAKMSTQTVRSLKLQNDGAEFELGRQREMWKTQSQDKLADQDARLVAAIKNDPRYRFDPNEPIGSKNRFRLSTTKEMEEAQAAGVGRGSQDADVGIKRIQNEWTASSRALADAIDNNAPPEQVAQLEAIEQQTRERYMGARGIKTNGSTPKAAPTAKEPDTQESKDFRQQVDRIVERAAMEMRSTGMYLAPFQREDSKKIADYLWSNREMLREVQQAAYDADPSRKGLKATHESALRWATTALQPQNQGHAKVIAGLRAAGVIQ